MNRYHVTVCTADQRIRYTAFAAYSFDCAEAALDMFGICAVTVTPA